LHEAHAALDEAPGQKAITAELRSVGMVEAVEPFGGLGFARQFHGFGSGSLHAVVTTDFLHDPNHGVIYGYRNGDFECKDGKSVSGGVLEARYTAGNKAGKPAGSGWYAVELGPGKCGAKEPGVYGCKLDSSGTATDCGMATINNQSGEVDLVTAR